MNPRVQVLLPTFERPHTIEWAIRSVLAQTVTDFQLHVVGDGCDEATERVVRGVGDPRIVFHRFPKAYGYGYESRNEVLREGQSPFVAYMTDDDLWFPDHLELALARLEREDLALVATRSVHVDFPDVLDAHFFAFDWTVPLVGEALRNWFMGAVNCVHRRGVFGQVGYWNPALARFGDREFYNRVRTSGLPAGYEPVPTVLRFFARHWQHRYAGVAEPPQRRYLPRLLDPAFREALRDRCRPGPRPLSVRRRQWKDFLSFGAGSGPKLLRFWWQRLRHPVEVVA